MTLRSTTNLVVPASVQMKRKELKTGFLYVYNKGYTGLQPVYIAKLWMSSIFPEIANNPEFGKNRKSVRSYVTNEINKNLPAGLLKVNKINDAQNPHFVASVPVAVFNRYNVSDAYTRMKAYFVGPPKLDANGQPLNEPVVQPTSPADLQQKISQHEVNEELAQHVIPGAQAIQAMHGIDARAKVALGECLQSIRVQYRGSVAVVFLDFTINKAIAQQLTTTEWIEIRNIDLYPLLMQWIIGAFGYSSDAPIATFSVSKIARTLPAVHPEQPRVNEYNVTINHDGTPLWVPKELDATTHYEDQFTQAGDQPNGSFNILTMDALAEERASGKEPKLHLPKNLPILVDWVNMKYTYTLSTGLLKVQDLSRTKKPDAGHIRSILDSTTLTEAYAKMFMRYGAQCHVEPKVAFLPEELLAMRENNAVIADRYSGAGTFDYEDYLADVLAYHKAFVAPNIMLKDISVHGDPILRPMARYYAQVYNAVVNNMEVVNSHFAVSSVASVLGYLTLIVKYASDYAAVELEANRICAPALNQKVDPEWEPPSIPLSAGIKFLPHQRKVRNLLKDSPDFAILPVQAGGGKSVLAITDVLYEIKANRSQPYLILCPSHLVAQYVKEIVYFTGGKMNAVPINSYVIFRNGYKRLTQMLEHAPRNTVVICDYDVLRYRSENICYGTTSVTVYPVIEFLRQFNFGYCLLDESHVVKNDSLRSRGCMQLIADIPKKRLASGTMAHDSPSDLALQIATMDPTLFGDRDKFNEMYGEDVSGSRVITWKPGAQRAIMNRIKTRVVVAGAMRKEWAALLPTPKEVFIPVDLSDAQKHLYDAILEESLEQMREDAKSNAALAKFFEPKAAKHMPVTTHPAGTNQAADEEAEDDADESAGESLEALLKFYLARLEQFLTAPTHDKLGARLEGDDRISPKVRKIIERVQLHLDQKIPGKVLIFTNYTASAEAIWEAFPPELQKHGILYVASDKVEAGQAFENDPEKLWMVGVENSMNTGLNLQFCSRLIRTETVWNPGTLEQGNARINRPELKTEDRREAIFYDWIVANNTMDVTKISRLISKIIAIAKFENPDNDAYEEIPDVPIIAMNAESIMYLNSWQETLGEYANSYKQYNTVKHEDYKAYRAEHGNVRLIPVPIAPVPADAKLMGSIPYTQGLEIHGTGKLGLVRVDDFLRQDAAETEEGEGGEEDDETPEGEGEGGEQPDPVAEQRRKFKEAANQLKGRAVHTEFGDGVIMSIMVKLRRISVLLPSGFQVRVAMSASFLIPETVKPKDIRKQLLQEAGDMPITPHVDTPGPTFRSSAANLRRIEKERKAQEEREVEKQREKLSSLSVELSFSVSNGFLGINYFTNEESPEATNALQALGFRPTPPFAYAHITNAKQLEKQFQLWESKGFQMDKSMGNISAAFQDLHRLLRLGKLKHNAINYIFSNRNQLKNFYRQEVKPSTSDTLLKPYPMIEDKQAYIVLPMRGQPASRDAVRYKATGVKWQMNHHSLVFYGLNLQATVEMLKKIKAAGIQIANVEDLKGDLKRLHKSKLRNEEGEGL